MSGLSKLRVEKLSNEVSWDHGGAKVWPERGRGLRMGINLEKASV